MTKKYFKYIFILCITSFSLSVEFELDSPMQDMCPLNTDVILDAFKNATAMQHQVHEATKDISQILEEFRSGNNQENSEKYEKLVNAYIDKKLSESNFNSANALLDSVFKFLTSVMSTKLEKSEKIPDIDVRSAKLDDQFPNSIVENLTLMISEVNNKLTKVLNAIEEQKGPTREIIRPDTNTLLENKINMHKYNTMLNLFNAHRLTKNVVKLDTGTYYFNLVSTSWANGRLFCEKYGMQLASLETAEEIQAVVLEIPTANKASCFYTSGSDMIARAGLFYWTNGYREEVNGSLWLEGKPNQYGVGKQACVFVNQNHGFTLLDTPCTTNCFSICEFTPYT